MSITIDEEILSTPSVDDTDPIMHTNGLSASTSTVPMNPSSRKKPKLYPWQNRFLSSFPWLRYNATSKTASCSFKKCEMYIYPILQRHLTN